MSDGDTSHHEKSASPVPTSRLAQAIRWFRDKVRAGGDASIREIIEVALEEEGAGDSISAEEKSILKNMIHFGELTVRDVMIPRAEILAVSRDISLDELKEKIIEIGHTRIPVTGASLDEIAGFLHVKDLFPYFTQQQPFAIERALREILFVPPSMRIVDLLMKMRGSGSHIAIVVDEFGGTDGLVTMEDLFEELVGEIQDEHDEDDSKPLIRALGDHVFEVDARATIERVEETLQDFLQGDVGRIADVDTLGGLLFKRLGRVPVRGEVVMLKPGLKAEVLSADPRRIRTLRITRQAQ